MPPCHPSRVLPQVIHHRAVISSVASSTTSIATFAFTSTDSPGSDSSSTPSATSGSVSSSSDHALGPGPIIGITAAVVAAVTTMIALGLALYRRGGRIPGRPLSAYLGQTLARHEADSAESLTSFDTNTENAHSRLRQREKVDVMPTIEDIEDWMMDAEQPQPDHKIVADTAESSENPLSISPLGRQHESSPPLDRGENDKHGNHKQGLLPQSPSLSADKIYILPTTDVLNPRPRSTPVLPIASASHYHDGRSQSVNELSYNRWPLSTIIDDPSRPSSVLMSISPSSCQNSSPALGSSRPTTTTPKTSKPATPELDYRAKLPNISLAELGSVARKLSSESVHENNNLSIGMLPLTSPSHSSARPPTVTLVRRSDFTPTRSPPNPRVSTSDAITNARYNNLPACERNLQPLRILNPPPKHTPRHRASMSSVDSSSRISRAQPRMHLSKSIELLPLQSPEPVLRLDTGSVSTRREKYHHKCRSLPSTRAFASVVNTPFPSPPGTVQPRNKRAFERLPPEKNNDTCLGVSAAAEASCRNQALHLDPVAPTTASSDCSLRTNAECEGVEEEDDDDDHTTTEIEDDGDEDDDRDDEPNTAHPINSSYRIFSPIHRTQLTLRPRSELMTSTPEQAQTSDQTQTGPCPPSPSPTCSPVQLRSPGIDIPILFRSYTPVQDFIRPTKPGSRVYDARGQSDPHQSSNADTDADMNMNLDVNKDIHTDTYIGETL